MKKNINEYKGLIFIVLTFLVATIVLVVGMKTVEERLNIDSYVMEER